mgnify:CR=1 FL=1
MAVKSYVGGLAFRDTPFDWPMWWMEENVLEYSPRPDGIEIADALGDTSLDIFRFRSHSREQALQRIKCSGLRFMHVGLIPSASECSKLGLPAVIEYQWPLAIRQVFHNGRHYAVICTPDGALWVADTGCGYHLVPEADVSRGSSVIVDNPGARKLHTANGEVRADECVRFSLAELGLTKTLATILPQTPRVLSIGASPLAVWSFRAPRLSTITEAPRKTSASGTR